MRLLSHPPVVRTTIVVLTLAMTITAPPLEALAAPTLDQQQPTIDTTVGGLAIGHTSNQILGQTITAGATGDLVRVDLPVACDGTGDLTIQIRDVAATGAPGPTVKSTTTIAGSTLPSFPTGGVTFRTLTLAAPVAVTPGSTFAFVLSSNGTTVNDGCGIFRGPVGQSYLGGDLYFDALPNAPGWIHNCGEFPNDRCDLPFRIWVEPPAPSADLSITKTLVNPSGLNVFSGTDQVYQFTVTNNGPLTATSVTVTDTLPPSVTYVSGPPQCPNSGGTISCSLGSLNAGQTATVFIQVRFETAGSYTNDATVSSAVSDANPSNNKGSHTQQVLPTADLFVPSAQINPTVAAPGGTVTYDVTVKNLGPDPTNDVALVQAIPAGSTFASISSPATTICGPGTNSGEYGCRFSSIPVNATRSMTVTVTAPLTQQALDTTWVASHIVPPLILDPAQGAPSSLTARSWVVFETVSGANVTTLTTDIQGVGATPDDPIETTVESPTSGTITITEQKQGASPAPTSWRALGSEVVISAPGGSASAPLRLTFRVDKSYLAQFTAATLEVFRNNSNTPVPDCQQPIAPALPSAATPIQPDPCVWQRTTLSDGDVEIVVFTSQASVWTFAMHTPFTFGGFRAPIHADVNAVNAGRDVPVKFSLDGFQGMVILDGSLGSRPVTCAGGAAAGPVTPVELNGGGLRYDATTDTYVLNWKTDPAWAGTCRELTLSLIDGTTHSATFAFE